MALDYRQFFYNNDDFRQDGYDDIDIGYLFGLYAVLKYYSTNNYSWADIDKEINDLVSRYSILNSTKKVIT